MDLETHQEKPDDKQNGVDEKMEVQDSEVTSPGEEAKVPKVGMTFRSEEELRDYYSSYGQSLGFSIAKISTKNGDDGKPKYFSLACARNGRTVIKNSTHSRASMKTNCKAKINVTIKDDELLVITRVYLDHNHDLIPGNARHCRHSKVVSPDIWRKSQSNDLHGIARAENAHLLVGANKCETLTCCIKECTTYIASGKQTRLDTGDLEALLVYFYRMQTKDFNFFYMIDTDQKCHIRNVFWADARCRAAYENFGDVVLFDSTYLINNYDVPLCSFIGVDHHGQSVLLGCGFIFTADTNAFMWLFKSWLICMLGRSPIAIITDECNAIQAAVAEVFPASRHRLCLWHIMTKLPVKLGRLDQYKVIKKMLENIVYDTLKSDEFEERWAIMIKEFNLDDQEWLKSLYSDHHRWVPLYVKQSFWAGVSITQRGDGMNAFFDDIFHSKTTLKQFVEQYDIAMKSRIEKENNADNASCYSVMPTITHHPIEKQFQEVYTNDIFKLFQDELRGLIFCNASFLRAEGSTSVFEVTETILGKDGMFLKEMALEVLFDDAEYKVQCLCHLFEFKGILCRHAISVFIKRKAIQIPSCYILDRWRKDSQRDYRTVVGIYGDVINHGKTERRMKLSSLLFTVQQLASESDGRCELLGKLLQEAKRKLLSVDPLNGNEQSHEVSIMPSENGLT